jgi:hypothetical protein
MRHTTTRRSVLGTVATGCCLAGAVGTAAGRSERGDERGNGNGRDDEEESGGDGKRERGRSGAAFVAPLTAGQSTKVKTSDGKGYARLFYDEDDEELTYRIEYEGELDITQIHIHHADPQTVDNRLTVFLQTYTENTDGTGEGSTVSPPRTVSGSVNDPEDLRTDDPAVAGGTDDIDEIVQAIIAEPKAYQINTHTTRSPGGEIRGQLRGPPIK